MCETATISSEGGGRGGGGVGKASRNNVILKGGRVGNRIPSSAALSNVKRNRLLIIDFPIRQIQSNVILNNYFNNK